MRPASKTDSYNATLDLQATLETFLKKLGKAESWSERLKVATSVVTKTGGNNLLHVAALHGATHILKELLDAIKEGTPSFVCEDALRAQNERGYTPLHYAASRGSLEMCKVILSSESDDDDPSQFLFYSLVNSRNKQGETPFFLAALHGRRETFRFLHRVSMMYPTQETVFPWIRNNGDTILHCTISGDYFGVH